MPEYHRARNTVVVAGVLASLWRMGLLPPGPLPLFGVAISDSRHLPYALGSLLAYGVLRMWIEWIQSDGERRRRAASRIDIGVATAIGITGGILIGNRLLTLPSFSVWLAVSVVGAAILGLLLGGALLDLIEGSLVARSREESRRLALPRFPVALRMTIRYAAVLLMSVGVVAVAVHRYQFLLASVCWPVMLGSAALAVVSDPRAVLFGVLRVSKVFGQSKADYVKHLRWAFDMHDTNYQIGGWDPWVDGHDARLYRAAERGDTASVSEYLAEGDDPDQPNMHGWTALMIAVAQQHADAASLLLDAGADPNRYNTLGRSSIMFAARYGNEHLVQMLLEHGADPNINKAADLGALAAAAEGGHLRVMELLLDAGADPAARDMGNRPVLFYAQARKQGAAAALLRRRIRDGEGEQTSD